MADAVGAGVDVGDRQGITVGIGVVGEHVEQLDVAAGDDGVGVVGGGRGAVLAVRGQDADHDLADGAIAVGVDDRVAQPVGAALAEAWAVPDRAVDVDRGGAERRLRGDRLDLDRVAVGIGVVGQHRDVDRSARHGAGDVGPGHRRAVDVVDRHEAHLHERAGLVAGFVGDVVAERERRDGRGVDRYEDLLAARADAQLGPRYIGHADDAQRAAFRVVVVDEDPRRGRASGTDLDRVGAGDGRLIRCVVVADRDDDGAGRRIAAAVGDRVRELRPCGRVGEHGHPEREAEHLFDLDALTAAPVDDADHVAVGIGVVLEDVDVARVAAADGDVVTDRRRWPVLRLLVDAHTDVRRVAFAAVDDRVEEHVVAGDGREEEELPVVGQGDLFEGVLVACASPRAVGARRP